jgi:hypothetical protein
VTATVSGLCDQDLLDEVLRCYKPHCRYLRSFAVSIEDGILRGVGRFEIPESCYIDDTGHLNAVETTIGYNQMLYAMLATTVRRRLHEAFGTWTMADFWRRQLSDVLIARIDGTFRAPIDPRSFSGEFTVANLNSRRLRPGDGPVISIDTTYRYWDEAGGASTGTARVAIVGS